MSNETLLQPVARLNSNDSLVQRVERLMSNDYLVQPICDQCPMMLLYSQ